MAREYRSIARRSNLPPPCGYGVHGSDSLVDGKMIHSLAADLQGQWMAFGDIRVEDRWEWVLGRIVATGSWHPRRIGGGRPGGGGRHSRSFYAFVLCLGH